MDIQPHPKNNGFISERAVVTFENRMEEEILQRGFSSFGLNHIRINLDLHESNGICGTDDRELPEPYPRQLKFTHKALSRATIELSMLADLYDSERVRSIAVEINKYLLEQFQVTHTVGQDTPSSA